MRAALLFIAHLAYHKLYKALQAQGVDPSVLETIFVYRSTPEMQLVLRDIFKAVAMVIARHKNEERTFTQLEKTIQNSDRIITSSS